MEINPDNNKKNEHLWYVKLKELLSYSKFIDSEDVEKISSLIDKEFKNGCFREYEKKNKEFENFYNNFLGIKE